MLIGGVQGECKKNALLCGISWRMALELAVSKAIVPMTILHVDAL